MIDIFLFLSTENSFLHKYRLSKPHTERANVIVFTFLLGYWYIYLKNKPFSLFWPLICSSVVWRGWLVPQLYGNCCLPYEKQKPLKFILQPKPRQLIDTQTKLRELQSAALIDGRTWKVACLFPLCDYSIKPMPVWLAGINMHGDSLSPLFPTSVWSDTVCLFFFVCQGAIHLSTSEHCKRVARCTSFSSVCLRVRKEALGKVQVAKFQSGSCNVTFFFASS